jgi:hypothetical protein
VEVPRSAISKKVDAQHYGDQPWGWDKAYIENAVHRVRARGVRKPRFYVAIGLEAPLIVGGQLADGDPIAVVAPRVDYDDRAEEKLAVANADLSNFNEALTVADATWPIALEVRPIVE